MSEEEHYLKNELDTLITSNTSIFQFIQEGSLDGIWYWDLESREQEWMSPRFWTLLGYDPTTKNHLASEWQDLIFPEDLTATLENLNRHFEDPNHPYDQVVRYKHKDGSTVWVRCRGIAIRNEKGKPIRMLGAHTELTREKLAEKQLKKYRDHLEELIFERTEALHALAGKVLSAQEEERSRLARELHDDFTQRLVAVAIHIGNLEQSPHAFPKEIEQGLRKIKDQVVKLSTDLNAVARRLHPAILDDLGLAAAIQSECNDFSLREKILTAFEPKEIPLEIPKECALCLYRIVQEGLRNVVKHAQAKKVLIRLTGSYTDITLLIQDSGIGFDPARHTGKRGLGLSSMKERVQLIQGTLSIHAQPGQGTAIEVKIPLIRRAI